MADDKKKIKDVYAELSAKYPLPDFELLNAECEISDDEVGDFPLRSILRRITSRYDKLLKVLDDMMHPDGSMMTMMEASVFEEDGHKKELAALYKIVAEKIRGAQFRGLNRDDQQIAEFVGQAVQQLPDLRMRVATLVELLEKFWQSQHDDQQKANYFG